MVLILPCAWRVSAITWEELSVSHRWRKGFFFLPHVRNPYSRNFCLLNLESVKFLLVESGILGFGIRNTAQGIRNPPKMGFQNPSSWNPKSTTWNPESKTVLVPLHSALLSFQDKIYSYFEKFCRKKCAGDNLEREYGIWSIHCSDDCSCRSLLLLLSFSTRKHIFMAFRANSFKFLWKQEKLKPPTMPFRIVACTFPDNLSRNSCIWNVLSILNWISYVEETLWWCNQRFLSEQALSFELCIGGEANKPKEEINAKTKGRVCWQA